MNSWLPVSMLGVIALISMAQGGPLGSLHQAQGSPEHGLEPQRAQQSLKTSYGETMDNSHDLDLLTKKCPKEYVQACCVGDHFQVPMYIQTNRGSEKCSNYASCCQL